MYMHYQLIVDAQSINYACTIKASIHALLMQVYIHYQRNLKFTIKTMVHALPKQLYMHYQSNQLYVCTINQFYMHCQSSIIHAQSKQLYMHYQSSYALSKQLYIPQQWTSRTVWGTIIMADKHGLKPYFQWAVVE